MKKPFFYSLLTAFALLLFAQSSTAEARNHCGRHSRTNIHVGVGSAYPCREAYVVRQYATPVMVAPVYGPMPYYGPVYATPAYVEEIYVPPRRPCFGGLSFSWNFFR